MISAQTLCRRGLLTLLLCLMAPSASAASSPVGYWITIDDDGKTPKAIVKIEAHKGKLSGRIVRLLNPKKKNPKCDECEGPTRGKPIVGMTIMWGLQADGDEWSGGYILDPENGETYRCLLELEAGGKELKVRGYIGITLLGRTQRWQRTSAP